MPGRRGQRSVTCRMCQDHAHASAALDIDSPGTCVRRSGERGARPHRADVGVKQANPNWGAGFGAIRPSAIDFNGDPTSFIDRIHWSRWGGRRAVGHGVAGFDWPGFAVADGTRYVRATVVAFDLGTCDGHPAYRREEWYFPQYGETFAAALAVLEHLHRPATQPGAAGRSHLLPRRASSLHRVSGGVTCAELPRIKALVGGAAHDGHSAKWISHGWVCGTDLNMGRDPQTVNCQRGNFKERELQDLRKALLASSVESQAGDGATANMAWPSTELRAGPQPELQIAGRPSVVSLPSLQVGTSRRSEALTAGMRGVGAGIAATCRMARVPLRMSAQAEVDSEPATREAGYAPAIALTS